jgi:SPP1 family phage portal protein
MDITPKQLDEIWDAQAHTRKKQHRRRHYYQGEHDICKRNEKHADGKKKANVPTGFAQYIIDMYVGAMTANPYQLSRLDESGPETVEQYTTIARDANLDSVDVENLRNALICGYGLELHEFVDGKFRVIPEKPEHWALVRDENDDVVMAITRFVLPAYSVFRGEMIPAAMEIMYTYDAVSKAGYKRLASDTLRGDWEPFEKRQHFYGQVPVVEWRATDDRESMLTSALLRQIDEYDDIDSLSGDDIRNVSDALLKIKGINSNWVKENEDVILRLRVLPIPDDAEAEYLTKTTDTERVTSRLARCREAIHTMGGVPDIQQVTGVTDHTSGSPKVQPGRWELVSSSSWAGLTGKPTVAVVESDISAVGRGAGLFRDDPEPWYTDADDAGVSYTVGNRKSSIGFNGTPTATAPRRFSAP